MRGRAEIEVRDQSVDLELAVARPHYVRAEVSGPLGVSLALFVVNDEWAQFLDLRARVVHRLPFSEFRKNSLRRDLYMAQLPLGSFAPDLLVEAALTRSGLPEGVEPTHCPYLEKENAYLLEVQAEKQSRRILLDPTSLAPVRIEGYEGGATRASWKLVFRDYVGSDWATLPREVEAFQGDASQWVFRWKEAERWNDFREAAFLWQPTASMNLKDY